jgi:peptidoglycan-associated lipoprotein
MGSVVIQVVKVVMVSGCVIGLLTGCSSRLRTTVVSGSDASKVQVTQLEPETVTVEEVIAQPALKETRMDIPVEEPARSAPRSELPAEIFATPKSTVAPSEISPFFEVPTPVPADESIASSMPSVSEPSVQRPSSGIPPISFEPELPALPTRAHDAAELPKTSPVQVAKVMPQEPEKVEITTETLEEALSDIYFDYDRFLIREDAMALLKANAHLLTAKFAEKNIVIEGHCDERGTQSYNMVLGEARANAVKTFLEDLGISSDKLEVVSYGKDKPFCREQTEECWQENRRGHFVIK